MTSSIDTNVLIDLWDPSPAINNPARHLLEQAQQTGRLLITGCVYAELLAGQGRTATALALFLRETRIDVDVVLPLAVYKRAGEAFGAYVLRRAKTTSETKRSLAPRRVLTDFLIGAHAEVNGFTLLTSDRRIFRAAFPDLRILTTAMGGEMA